MATQSPFSFLEDFLQKSSANFQPPAWVVDETQRRIVLLLNHILMQEPEAMRRLARQKGLTVLFQWRAFTLQLLATPAGLLDRAAPSHVPDLTFTLTEYDKEYLAQNFTAFFRRDYKRVAQLHIESGWVPAHTRVDELEAAIRTVCEPYFDRPLKEISLGMVLLRLFQTSRRFQVEIQPQLVLLQKTLLNIEGLGRQLDPELDLWNTAKPFLEQWMMDQIGPKKLWEQLKEQAPRYAKMLPELPRLLHDYLAHRPSDYQRDLRELLVEQKRTNKLLQGLVYGCIGFVLGLIVMQLVVRVELF